MLLCENNSDQIINTKHYRTCIDLITLFILFTKQQSLFFCFVLQPAFIYDPRHTIGSARQLAKKNLGKRHLVYFFECRDAPFSVLSTAKITK